MSQSWIISAMQTFVHRNSSAISVSFHTVSASSGWNISQSEEAFLPLTHFQVTDIYVQGLFCSSHGLQFWLSIPRCLPFLARAPFRGAAGAEPPAQGSAQAPLKPGPTTSGFGMTQILLFPLPGSFPELNY